MSQRRYFSAAAVLLLFLAGCHGKGSDVGDEAELSAPEAGAEIEASMEVEAGGAAREQSNDVGCSTGPVHEVGAPFEQGKWEDAGTRCTPHCGQEQQHQWLGTGLRVYGIGALPSGECAARTAPCSIDVGRPCRDDPAAIWLNFVCKCSDGMWSCAGSYQGGGVCPRADASL